MAKLSEILDKTFRVGDKVMLGDFSNGHPLKGTVTYCTTNLVTGYFDFDPECDFTVWSSHVKKDRARMLKEHIRSGVASLREKRFVRKVFPSK